MVPFCIWIVLQYAVLSVPCSSYTLDEGIRLMNHTLDGYDRRFRPVLNQSKPIEVNMTFNFVGLTDFDHVNEQFSVVGYFILTWVDEKLSWDPSSYSGITELTYSVRDIWFPVIVLANPTTKKNEISQDWMSIFVESSGAATFEPTVHLVASCSIDVTYYPFDIQICTMVLIPTGVFDRDMTLRSPVDTILQNHFTENGEWAFIELTALDDVENNNNAIYVTFKMKRKPTFLLVNTVLPIVFMAVISVFVFVLPAESGERVSFSITVLLALAVFFTIISDNLPNTSSPLSYLSYFLTVILVYSALMCMIAICNLRIYFKNESTRVPRYLAYVVHLLRCKRCKTSNTKVDVVKQIGNEVSVTEIDANEKPPLEQSSEDMEMDVTSHNQRVTWMDVSAAIDVICFVSFTAAIFITCLVYLHVMSTNS